MGFIREDGVEVVQMTEQMILDTVEYYANIAKFLKGCGFWNEDSAISNLFYKMPIKETASDVVTKLKAMPNQIGVSLGELKKDSQMQIGAAQLTVTSKTTGQTY